MDASNTRWEYRTRRWIKCNSSSSRGKKESPRKEYRTKIEPIQKRRKNPTFTTNIGSKVRSVGRVVRMQASSRRPELCMYTETVGCSQHSTVAGSSSSKSSWCKKIARWTVCMRCETEWWRKGERGPEWRRGWRVQWALAVAFISNNYFQV